MKLDISEVKSISQNLKTWEIEVIGNNNKVIWRKHYKDRLSSDSIFIILSKKLNAELIRKQNL